uniref:Uncharacterized protein n=1 Tax=Nothobranchius rachovii TaxID=451742 RepID=A0A1A8PMV4_9TELE
MHQTLSAVDYLTIVGPPFRSGRQEDVYPSHTLGWQRRRRCETIRSRDALRYTLWTRLQMRFLKFKLLRNQKTLDESALAVAIQLFLSGLAGIA